VDQGNEDGNGHGGWGGDGKTVGVKQTARALTSAIAMVGCRSSRALHARLKGFLEGRVCLKAALGT